ncbi:MAG: LysR family transcriptional regulator [Hyphomicrobiaceae bacterium]
MSKVPRSRHQRSPEGAARREIAIDPGTIDLKLLSIFETVLSECSFSRAGRRLGMTQSAVSQAIARLRPMFNDELFERTGRGVRPTPRARELEAPIRAALRLLRNSVDSKAAFDPHMAVRTFFVAMQAHVAEAFALQLYASVPPDSMLRLYVVQTGGRDVESGLRYGEPEVAITRDSIDAEGFRNELLYTEDVVVVARRNHPQISRPLTWETYARLRHVAVSLSSPSETSRVDREFKRRGDRRIVPIAMPTPASALRVAEETELVCTLGHRLAAYFGSRQALEIHELPVSEMTLPMFMVWHDRFDNDRGHEWLRNRLRDVLM